MQVTRNVVSKFGRQIGAGVSVVGMGIGTALAEVPTAVSDALSEAKTDSVTVAGLAFTIFVAILVFSYMRRAAK